MNETEVKKEFSGKSGEFRLWLGFLLPPVVWAVQLQTAYLLTEYACSSVNFIPIHIVSFAALLISLFGGYVSWENFLKTGGEWKNEKSGVMPRSRFMAILGILTGALFSLVILAQWLPTLMGVPCQK